MVSIIINPISGGARPSTAQRRAQIALSAVERHGDVAEIFVTERAGHARELTKAALQRGTRLVMAWGGDGTMNEVATALAFGDVPLGLIPSGSGNGLATELGVPRNPERAIAAALKAEPRRIDLGEIGDRLFVNAAGVGIDAYVAAQFNNPGGRRGFIGYLQLGGRALFKYRPGVYRITLDDQTIDTRAVLLSIANGTQWGNNACIAPRARVDDGLLDLVVMEERSRLSTLAQVPKLFTGKAEQVPGCTMLRMRHATIEAEAPMVFHVDGESVVGGATLKVRVHPGALWIAAPNLRAAAPPTRP